MADFDVAAQSLASPPLSTPPATYTPAISTKNLGIHDAVASGFVSFYRKSTGVLVAQFVVTSGTIHPGATSNAAAAGVLDLSAEPVGTQFIVTGYVSTPNDQVPGNNQLAPVTITISAVPPPPPPPVGAHASQHEAAGADTISVDGLTGELTDPQTPKAHATEHEPGGSDEISGIGAAPHSQEHENGGDDEINVSGLTGVLASPQTAITHDNARHSEEYITSADVPTVATVKRWQPRVIEADDGEADEFVGDNWNPNIGGAAALAAFDADHKLHSGATFELERMLVAAPFVLRPFIIRVHAALLITGDLSLRLNCTLRIAVGTSSVYLLQDNPILGPTADQQSVVLEATAALQIRNNAIDIGGGGVLHYPASGGTRNTTVFGSGRDAAGNDLDDIVATLFFEVPDGDANNFVDVLSAVIEVQPAADPES